MIPMFENFHPGIIFILVGFFAALCAPKERRMILACCPVLALLSMLHIAPGTSVRYDRAAQIQDLSLQREGGHEQAPLRRFSELDICRDFLHFRHYRRHIQLSSQEPVGSALLDGLCRLFHRRRTGA